MVQKHKGKHSESKHSKRKKIDHTEDEKRTERLNAISKKKEERMVEVKRDLEEKLRRRLIVKNSDLKKEAKEQERELRNEKKSLSEKQMVQIRHEMKKIIEAGIEKVNATKIIFEKIKSDGKDRLTIGSVKYKLKSNVHMVGWGRESVMLGAALEKIIGKQMKKGFLVVPEKTISEMWNHQSWYPKLDTKISYFEVGVDGQPNEKTWVANKKIAEYCKKLNKIDILVVILSGGTDDLLCLPKGNIGIQEKIHFLERLKVAKASRKEINTIRKKLSQIRGH